LQEALAAYLRACAAKKTKPLELGVYGDLAHAAAPDLPGLALLAPLLVPLLKAAPRGVVNQVALAESLAAVIHDEKLVSPREAAGAAERAASGIRTALAHLRRLQQQAAKFKARAKGVSEDVILAVRVMLSHYKPGDDGPAPPVPPSWGGPPADAAEDAPDGRQGSLAGGASSASLADCGSPLAPASPASAAPPTRELGRLPSFDFSPPPLKPVASLAEPEARFGPQRAVGLLLSGPFSHRPPGFRQQAAQVKAVRKAVGDAKQEKADAKRADADAKKEARRQQQRRKSAAAAAASNAKKAKAKAKAIDDAKHADAGREAAGAEEPAAKRVRAVSSAAKDYILMRYRKQDACACREAGAGGKQLFQVIIKGDPGVAESLAAEGRQRLLAGEEVSAVKGWLLAKKSALRAAE